MEKMPPDMKVRLSAELRKKVERAARQNNRTLNSEIVFRLEASFPNDATNARSALAKTPVFSVGSVGDPDTLLPLGVQDLEQRVASLEKAVLGMIGDRFEADDQMDSKS